MEFKFKQEEEKLLKEIHQFLEREVTPELQAETAALGSNFGGPEARKLATKLGARGWLCPSWPKEYGGLGTSEMLRFMIVDDLAYMGFPVALVGANMAGPTIMRHGSEVMKELFLPPIARGEVEYALGYTEPQAGSDLAAIEIRAEDKGDHFLLNGQKMFNTACHVADYHWLGARTDPNIARYKGISLMIVDMKSPGITIRPMITMAGFQTNEVFYDNVKVPRENLVGDLNKGFYYIMAALDFERMYPVGNYRRVFDELLVYVKEAKVDGRPIARNPLVRKKMAELTVELEAATLLYYQLAHLLDKGINVNYQASMEKLFGSEVAQHLARAGMEILGLNGQLHKDSKWAPSQGLIEHRYRWTIVETIYGGTSEVQRNVVALRGLGLPAR